MDSKVKVQIDDLRAFSQWIPEIAQWHHAEWIKGLPEKVYKEQQKEILLSRDVHEREHSLRAHLACESIPTTLVAHSNQRPVGSVSLVNYQFSRDQKPSHWLTNLFVVEQYRQQGLGSRLITSALDFAADSKLGTLYLYTRDLTKFYQARGWVYSHDGVVQGRNVAVLKYTVRSR